MQRFNIITAELCRCLLIASLFSAESVWSDDLDTVQIPDNDQEAVDIIAVANSCFARAKERGTVWLKTQQAINYLATLEHDSSSIQAAQTAGQIVRDCRLINNQHALEQARYLLSTMESKGFDDRALGAIRAQLMAADGEAALALATNLQRELESNATSALDSSSQIGNEQ